MQPFLDGHFHFHIPLVVALEDIPLVRSMPGQVPGPAPVGLGFLARHAEIADQIPAFLHLLVVQIQHCPHSFQGKGQPHIGGPDHGALPAGRVQEPGTLLRQRVPVMEGIQAPPQVRQIPGQAHPFEIGIEGPFDDGVIGECLQNLFREGFPLGQVDYFHLSSIHRIAKKEDFKIRGLGIFIDPAFG